MVKVKSLVFLILAAVILLTGCGKEEAYGSESENTARVQISNESGSGEGISLTSSHVSLEGRFAKALVKDGMVYGGYIPAGAGLTVVVQDIQTQSVLREISIENVDEAYGLAAAEDGTVLVVASQEDVDTVIALINSADRRYYSFTEVENIITEEAAYYFAGQKSFEEVAALIQNRVQLYLSEG